MSDEATEANGSASHLPEVVSPERLRSEAVSLGLILLAALVLAMLERRGCVPWTGYPSSLVLLALSMWHKWRFGVVVRFFRARGDRRALPLAVSIALLAVLILSACTPLQPGTKPTPSLFAALHLLILVPLSEEFYFRGLLFGHLRKGFTGLRATLLCSALFAILHLPFTASLTAGCLSLIACALVLKTGTLAGALQLHIAWNALTEIHGIGDPSARWVLAILASGVVLIMAVAWPKETGRRSADDAN
jgi:membrane protease YdiL (CAAX protease family)